MVQASIGGMTCSTCSNAIESSLNRLSAVTQASVSLITNTAEVHFLLLLAKKGTFSTLQIRNLTGKLLTRAVQTTGDFQVCRA